MAVVRSPSPPATGLLYVGNGQYYDPSTGRFLTRDARPNSANPYVPWNPIGAIVGPLGLIALVFGRKRKRGKWDTLIIIVLLGISAGVGIAACAPAPVPNVPAPGTNQPPASPAPTQTPVPTGPGTSSSGTAGTATPPIILTLPECPTPTWTLTPTNSPTPTVTVTAEPDKMDAGAWGPKSTNLYNLYLRLYEERYKENGEETLWWQIYGGDGNFTLVDFVAMVFIREVASSPGFAGINMDDYVEAMGRHAYTWCIDPRFSNYGCDSTTNKGMIYYLVEWSQIAQDIEEFCARNVKSCPLDSYFQSIYGTSAETWALKIANGIHNPQPAWRIFDKYALWDAGNRHEQVLKPHKIDLMHSELKHKAHYESPDGLFFITTYCETEYLKDAMDRFNNWGCVLEQNFK